MCVLEPTGDMLYFEVIKLFNCVSIFWNGIISSLKRFLKGIYGASCLWLILVLDDLFLGAHALFLLSREGKCVPVVPQVVFGSSNFSWKNSFHHVPQHFEHGTGQHLCASLEANQ